MLQILTFFLCAVTIAVLAKRRFETVLAPTMLIGMLLLTALAMVQKLSFVDIPAPAMLACIAVLLLYALWIGKLQLKELANRILTYVLTPGLVCFVILIAFYYYASEPMIVWWRDDINYWALEVKSLFHFDGLVDGSQHLNAFFSTYTPGLQVLQWWVLHIAGEYSEALLFFGLFATYAVFLLPLLQNIKWKQCYLIPIAAALYIIVPVWGNSMSYVFLSVDTALALCFGYALLQIWRLNENDRFGLFSIALALCGLVLIKQIGIIFAIMAIILMYVLKKQHKQNKWAFRCSVASPIILFAAWMFYCKAMNLSGYHTNGLMKHILEILRGSYILPASVWDITYSFVHALIAPYTDSITYYTTPPLDIPSLLWLVFLPVAPLMLKKYRARHRMRNLSFALLFITFIYLLVHYIGFYTVFYDELPAYIGANMDNMCLLMERYLAPLLLGMGILVLGIFIEAFGEKQLSLRKPIHLAGLTTVLTAFLLSTNWAVMDEGLLPDHYFQQERAISVQTQVLMDHYWGESLEGYENAKVLAGFELNSDFIKNLRYTFAPAAFESPEPSYTANAELLAQHIVQNQITHLICFDEENMLYAPACELVAEDEALYTWVLYEVVATEDGVELSEYF